MSGFRNYLDVLRNRYFLFLWSGSLLSGIGDAVISVSLVWMVYKQTNSPLLLSLTLICLEFPKIIAAPIFGVMLDRLPAIVFAVIANVSSGCLFLFLSLIPLNSMIQYIGFLALITLSSALAPITKSATNIIVTEAVEQDKLITANSLMNIQFDLALSLGPVVGGVLLALGHVEVAYLFNAATFFIAACLYHFAMPAHARKNRNERKIASTQDSRFKQWKRELREGVSWLLRSPSARALVMSNFIWNFLIWGTSSALMPLYADQHLASGANGYGLLTSMLSVGIVIGSFVTGMFKIAKPYLKMLVFLSIAAHAIAYSLLSLQAELVTAILIVILCGIVSSPAMIYNRTYMQMIVPAEYRGRVFTVIFALGALGYPFGTTLAETSVTAIGAESVALLFACFGGVTVLVTFLLWWTTKEKSSQLKQEATPVMTTESPDLN